MSTDTATLSRRAALLVGAAGVSTLTGCLDRVAPIDEDAPAAEDTETPEPRIPDNTEGTGDIPLVRFAARSGAWVGLGPEGFSDEENPPLHLTEGEEYEILWENRDGDRHRFAVVDGGGEELASTDAADSHGAVESMVITASGDMSRYQCSFHSEEETGEITVV